MDLLNQARQEIDAIDSQMALLFTQRMEAVKKVISYKIENNMAILDSGREKEVIAKNIGRLPENTQDIVEYYKDFISHNMLLSREFQAEIIKNNTAAYQGVEGAFSHLALRKLFPLHKQLAFDSWADVFTAVENETCVHGVLPFENSHAGDVSEVLDLCFTHPNIYVTDMYDLTVQQNLLAKKASVLSDIKTVVSHPQALRQSASFIKQMGATQIEYPNTAAAAKYVSEQNDPTIAAIASVETAELYNLDILALNISERADNTTRFVVISKKPNTTGDRFSLLFTVKHQAGTLAEVIKIIAQNGYNMESIKSRPMPKVSWEYYFYTELVGDGMDAEKLVEQLTPICHTVRILGAYQR